MLQKSMDDGMEYTKYNFIGCYKIRDSFSITQEYENIMLKTMEQINETN